MLNEALEQSRGELVTKFDDDDYYGPEHIWDLVLAHEYSRASLVGKAAEYVYLEGSDRTLRRFRGGAERVGSKLSLAGGAMIIARNDLDAVAGWRPVPSGVDRALMHDVVATDGRLYRTHGRGYMLVRHAADTPGRPTMSISWSRPSRFTPAVTFASPESSKAARAANSLLWGTPP